MIVSSSIQWLLEVLALPQVGLSAAFIISLVSATLLPLGSEPAVFAVAKADIALFWPVILVATVGNTLGGMVNYWMGYGATGVFARSPENRWFVWTQRFGAQAMLLAWLPGIGDPLCVLAGWLKLPFWPSVFYMAVGKFLRYVTMTWLLLYVPDGFWRQAASWLS
jgi:membrane protein YqaA with SNARE-associated domain